MNHCVIKRLLLSYQLHIISVTCSIDLVTSFIVLIKSMGGIRRSILLHNFYQSRTSLYSPSNALLNPVNMS